MRPARRFGGSLVVGILALALGSVPAHATTLSAQLSASNGEGSFDATVACPAGDGPSWRYAYSGASTPLQGPFGGIWNSTFAVHDAGAGRAFVPAGAGRMKISVDRGGDASLELTAGGSCGSAPLTLSTQPDGDPVASGTLPVAATGGSGALRGLTGSGTAALALELGPGADNVAQIDLAGDFDVLQPRLTLGPASAFWRNTGDYLAHRLTVILPVRNPDDPATAGDAFAVRLTQASLSGRAASAGVPAQLGRIDARGERLATLTFANASPGRTYTLAARVQGTDALDAPLPALAQSQTVHTPLLP